MNTIVSPGKSFPLGATVYPSGVTPHSGYSSCGDPLAVLDEFRDMVKAFHRAGIEIILDVVYNHTAEGGETGPTLCFKGLANEVYYTLQSHSLAITASAVSADLDLYLVLNAYWEPLSFDLPPIPEDGLGPWRRWLDTFLETPDDVCRPSNAPVVTGSSYLVNPRSIVALARIAN